MVFLFYFYFSNVRVETSVRLFATSLTVHFFFRNQANTLSVVATDFRYVRIAVCFCLRCLLWPIPLFLFLLFQPHAGVLAARNVAEDRFLRLFTCLLPFFLILHCYPDRLAVHETSTRLALEREPVSRASLFFRRGDRVFISSRRYEHRGNPDGYLQRGI